MSSAAIFRQNITEFNRALNDLSRNDNNRNSGNVDTVLRPAASINSFLASNRTNNDVTNKWNLVRSDLTTLASYYRVSWDWNNYNTTYPTGNQYGDFDSRLTGTYSRKRWHERQYRDDNRPRAQ